MGSRKTIVNVKICTGVKEMLKGLPFPPGESSNSNSSIEEEEEIGEEDKGWYIFFNMNSKKK